MSMIIDMHTHIYNDATLQDYLAKAEGQISKIITYAYFESKHDLKDTDTALAFAANHPNDVFVVAGIDIENKREEQLSKMRHLFEQKRIVGLKFYPGYQHFFPYDERIDPFAKLCAEFGKPLIFHSGITNSDVKGTKLKYTQPKNVDEIAVRHPNTNFIICHFGFPEYMDTGLVLSDNDNVYSEISGTIYGVDDGDLEKLMQQNIADMQRVFNYFSNSPDIREKIMFATDFQTAGAEIPYLGQLQPYITYAKSLFEEQYHKNVFSGLTEKLFFTDKKTGLIENSNLINMSI